MVVEILYLYELMTIIVPAVILILILNQAGRRRKNACRINYEVKENILLVLLAIYIGGVVHLTGFGTFEDLQRLGANISIGEINLIPFLDLKQDLRGYLLNIALFIPLGILLPLIWKEFHKIWKTLLFGFLLSLLIEISQIFNFRSSDINDLLMNTLGTLIGWVIVRVCFRLKKEKTVERGRMHGCIHAAGYVGVLLLCYFFLFHENWATGILYGSLV